MSKAVVVLVLLSLLSVALAVCNQGLCVKPTCPATQKIVLHNGDCCPTCGTRACTQLCTQPTCGTGWTAVQTDYACCPVCVDKNSADCGHCPQVLCPQGYGLVVDLAVSCCPFCVPYTA